MYAITNWATLPNLYAKADTLKISEHYDDVIVVEQIPQGYTMEVLGTENEVRFISLHKIQDEVAVTTDSKQTTLVEAVAALNLGYKGSRKLHVTYDPLLVVGNATTILLKTQDAPQNSTFSVKGFNVSDIRNFWDSGSSTTRGYYNDTLLFHGTENKIWSGVYISAKQGLLWLINEIIAALDNPIPIKEDSSKIIEMISSMLQEKEKSLADRINQIQDSIKEITSSLTEEVRAFERSKIAQATLQSYGADKKALAIREIDNIKKLAGIDRAFCNNNKICAITLPMVSSSKDHKIYLGRVAIEVNIRNSSVLIFPVDIAVKNTKAHPHSSQDGNGSVCLGNITGDLAKMIGEYELSSAFSLIIAFIETFNEADAWGSSYALWPRVVDGKIVFPEEFEKRWIVGGVVEEGMTV
jgi:hypothetical protein